MISPEKSNGQRLAIDLIHNATTFESLLVHHIEVQRNLGISSLNNTREPLLIGIRSCSGVLHANTAMSWLTIIEV